MVAGTSSELELDIPLAGSPVAELTTCERNRGFGVHFDLHGTDQSRRQPAKWKKKGLDGAMEDEVLVQTIGEALERMATEAQWQQEQSNYISMCCKHIEQQMRMLPQDRLTQFEMDSLLYRFSKETHQGH